MDSSGNNNTNQIQQNPGLMGAHAQYIKGLGESTIGSISGSQAWSASGEQDKAAAVDAMRKAADKRDPNQGYGKAEEWAGKLTGCEGMQKEGAASSQKRSD
ncbi:hypothetical protein BBK36DRAFT_1168078 [Trichoderma citrinoviride]|uniref:CsbD-like domain-containing protein n=1 Tax=Trichoderma citrinoviride TaxID=58853 RepID=A0A2T4BES1_9HYPO|nr:hypothetical protein BBK36DRAFT_1168078 [Trichoderma citrinoviride]PTB67699.1 hypothetical protein BBK36DRAFT_1168078 [Trichoderma citrinoviride]